MLTEPYTRSGFTPNLEDFARVPNSTVGHLSRAVPAVSDPRALLHDSWQRAQEAGQVVDKGVQVSFPIAVPEDVPYEGALPLVATLVTNKFEGKPWALTYAGPDSHHVLDVLADNPDTPRSLERFAYIPWDQALAEVARAALPEPWDFGDGSYEILRSYMRYTYQRAAIQGRVLVSKTRGLAALNLGLVDKAYNDLYLCFGPNPRQGFQTWCYAGVCRPAWRGLGKQLMETFPTLPEHVSYFESVSDLIFDSRQPFHTDIQHIIVDNVDRLPLPFLREQFFDHPQLLEELDAVARVGGFDDEGSRDAARESYDHVRDLLEEDDALFRRVSNRIDDAIDLARKRTQWNYRTAIPSYYPASNEMALLLPLCLQSDDHSDNALVVHLAETGSYIGETILTMRQAYLDARLICRPEHDWLLPE